LGFSGANIGIDPGERGGDLVVVFWIVHGQYSSIRANLDAIS
jgi:hypothetical protein